ncbi:MAG: dipeptide/oligopeptide/nickel ABC transporter ATP-binding protein [Coriobacteriaceae bacterium]|nr:dipeptide/oligopeptide/nickel ABC transporter ATP-binding protein [Coriobacteriaceae bacterium]
MLLETRGICKRYRTRDGVFTALDNASIEVEAGETVGLIGTSGSGKSTLANIVVGLEVADSGTVSFEDKSWDASSKPSRRGAAYRNATRRMQMVFQNPTASFSERMRIGDGIAEGVAYRGVPRERHAAMVSEVLEMVGLPQSYARRYPWELSGGECQRAAIARAIISRPDLLICDEPTSALDVTVQAQIVHLIADLCRDMGMACLFISHDLALVRGLCKWVYVMDAGCIVESGRAGSVLDSPRSEAARRLLDSVVTF